MKNKLCMLIIVLVASPLHACSTESRMDENIAREAGYHLSIDPVTAKIILSSVPDCDEKYALMHRANAAIADKCRENFYYQDKIYPHGWYESQTPNIFEKHVMENSEQFNSGQEGISKITANDYWIKKIKDPNHPIFADFEYQKIRLHYEGAWEDGDGSKQSPELI
ncbi:MAG: hypothetical protein EHM30_09760, partial [Desulfobacteraceae bacterium]